MASKKPSRLAVTTNPPVRVFVGTPVNIIIEGDNHQADGARVIHVQVQVVHFQNGTPLVDLVPLNGQATLNGPATPDGASPVRFTAAAMFTPTFLGTHIVKVTAWNSKTGEKPKDGKDHVRKTVTFRAG